MNEMVGQYKTMPVDRQTLEWVRDWSDEMVTTEGLTRQWRRAYAQLSVATDYVLAKLERSEVEDA